MRSLVRKVVLYLLRSRVASRYFIGLSLCQRKEILSQVWRNVNCGLDERGRYDVLRNAYKDRRMKNYPLLDSGSLARIYGFFDVIKQIRNVAGDVVECGIGRGVSLAYVVSAVSFFRLEKTVYGFDSFCGFPPARTEDIGERVQTAGDAPEGWTDTSPELVTSIFEHDKDNSESLLFKHPVRVVIVPGFFHETLPDNLPANIAFLHVDCDLYESTKVVLEYCLPRMSPEGIVLFDEYHDERWPGARKAADEISLRYGLKISHFPTIDRFGIKIPVKSYATS